MATEIKESDLEALDQEELRQLLVSLDALSTKETNIKGRPQNDDELHLWIKDNLGINLTRTATCPDHDAPFDIIADLFFGRVNAALVMANRGGGKTWIAAIWQYLNCRFNPEIECATVGAIEIQAKRAYSYLRNFIRKGDDDIRDSLISETVWEHGAKAEILTGSKSSVNGPHPQRVHRDEIELMDREVYQESLQMEASKQLADGTLLPAQTLVTSTRKSSDGLMQEILDECKEAVQEGREPPFKVYTFCIKDIISEVTNCREAYPDLPEEEKCNCHLIQKGEWEEGKPRTFDQVCQGDLAKARGYKPLSDAQQIFLKSSPFIWEAQQECKRPYVEDVTFPEFTREKFGIKNFDLDPENGPIYQGIDFGGTHPHCVQWMQVLGFEVEVLDFKGNSKRLPQGTRVLFDQIYEAEIGNMKLADLIVAIERGYKKRHPKFRVVGRFADPQAKAARLDFKEHDPPLICSWPTVTREKEEHIKRMKDIFSENLFAVDVEKCPMFLDEIEVYNVNKNKKTFDHAVDCGLYVVSNHYFLEQKGNKSSVSPLTAGQTDRYSGHSSPFDGTLPVAKSSPLRRQRLTEADKWK